ncbi:conjugal transfer protein TrbE [Klebsiella variicola]|uniref:conjugal transfer protein TrbE n=1 Tax=Klebsiella TaxID=570 RepID=UPI000D74425E|nr:conjugal transfer protein TrbE [Klebsiella variicola]HBZ7370689.1 conjugal transfer protein TrbE [Klebsiella variicola subsp. variicola]EKT9143046.1 conjugal transfer protein TrbE [Klebsiella variicola]ELY7236049.1 conjugal transfer protein TrbE [Klebsiella variicola]PXM16081.1 conjugal transfer protein TrbE [Klebsiella variicola]HDF2349293.1 conjugal transfer protein TrbE [Klebsiella variicola]
MKMNFHKQPVIDFDLRLTLTIIIISPVIYFSWDAVKGTSGSDYVESVVFILLVGFFWFVSYLFFTSLAAVLRKKTEEE